MVERAFAQAGVPGDARLAVACSHGPDSLALAHALVPRRPTLVYVDHGLRPEAREEARRVEAFAAARGLPSRVLRVKPRGKSEDALRAARYAALDTVEADWIALGHTASDQAETVISRLIRGTGIVGLAAIPAVRGRYIRPLLGVTRADVLAYCRAHALEPSHDASNDGDAYLRNRVRHAILPALRRENPRVDEALVRVAQMSAEIKDALDWAAERARAEVTKPSGHLDAPALARLPRAVARRLLQGFETHQQDAILDLCAKPTAGTQRCAFAVREYDDLLIGIQAAMPPAVDIRVEGDDGPYVIRTWRPGDRIRLRAGSRKLSDCYTDARVPRARRPAAFVVVRESDGVIVWAEHVGAAVASGTVRVTLTDRETPANTRGCIV